MVGAGCSVHACLRKSRLVISSSGAQCWRDWEEEKRGEERAEEKRGMAGEQRRTREDMREDQRIGYETPELEVNKNQREGKQRIRIRTKETLTGRLGGGR